MELSNSQMFMAVFNAIVVTLVGYLVRRIVKWQEKEEAFNDGLRAILRDKIIQSGTYFIELGEIPFVVKENLDNMFIAYHKLGGNGAVTEIHEQLKELPTRVNIK